MQGVGCDDPYIEEMFVRSVCVYFVYDLKVGRSPFFLFYFADVCFGEMALVLKLGIAWVWLFLQRGLTVSLSERSLPRRDQPVNSNKLAIIYVGLLFIYDQWEWRWWKSGCCRRGVVVPYIV